MLGPIVLVEWIYLSSFHKHPCKFGKKKIQFNFERVTRDGLRLSVDKLEPGRDEYAGWRFVVVLIYVALALKLIASY